MAVRDTASVAALLLVLCHTWGAWADLEVNMEPKVEVSLRQTAQITCTYTSDEGIGGTIIEWFYVPQSGSARQRIYYQDTIVKTIDKNTQYSDRISVNGTGTPDRVVLTIRDVQVKDEVEFICLIRSLSGESAEGSTNLRVFETPGPPTIEAVTKSISVNADKLSEIGICLVKKGYPKPNVTWYKDNTPLRSKPNDVDVTSGSTRESNGLYSVKSVLRMKVMKEDKDAKFYCEVTYFVPGETRMAESLRINISVSYPPTAVDIWVESPKGRIKEGDTVQLHCSNNGNSVVTTNIKNLKSGDNWDEKEVVLQNITRLDSGDYMCTVTDLENYEEISEITTVFVHYLDPAVLTPSDTVLVDQGEEIRASCNALSSLHTNTAWFKNGVEVSEGHSLMMKEAKYEDAGTYICEVTAPEIEGLETSSSLHVHVKGPPQIEEKGEKEIETSEESIDLSCRVRGYPTPKITWTTSDGKVINAAPQTETEEGAESEVRVQVASDTTVFCNASNPLGTDGTAFNIKVKLTIHTTTPATTTTTTTTTRTTSTIPKSTVKAETPNPSKEIKKGSNGVIIAVIIILILLLAILGSVLYFLYKKGKICNRSGKQDITKEKSSRDNIVVEMKSDNTEEAILLGVNGDKQPPGDQ